jgi:hypothetical protein
MSIFVTRYNENGHVDSNFNNGHVVTIAHPDFRDCMPDAFAVRESDGAIVVVGYASPEAPFSERTGLIAVLNASGSFNLAFNGGKTLISRLLEEGSRWEACAWQKDGQAIILGGSGGEGRIDSNRSVLTARYLFDGTLDQSFNGQGWAVYKHPRGNASYEGMTMTLDNKLVICSHVYTSGIRRGCVLRYLT